MASKIIILATIVAACNAGPIWYTGSDLLPGVIMRIGRSPSISYGFGSGFSSNIGGISHSTGIGASFQSGEGQAYGSGIGASDGTYARGVGIANAGNSYQPMAYQPAYQAVPQNRPAYGSAVSSAQNFGNYGNSVSSAQSVGSNQFNSAVSTAQTGGPARFNTAVSSAQSGGPARFNTALSSAQSAGPARYNSAISSAQNLNGYGTAISATNNGFGSSVSSAQTRGIGYGAAVSASENIGGYGASTAQAVQQGAAGVQHSGATSINGPGIRAAHSHAVNTGFY
ncbi:fibroin heavy chain-like [Trichoplusia ni]|uniref:Fibroin heavy chain-like n=1 Tax=Trichoplusia ni TaxID=7111 RepID=A0A7E5VV84_TRINI|nr:fibroin heavy chain-like [Trichoplusia ni]